MTSVIDGVRVEALGDPAAAVQYEHSAASSMAEVAAKVGSSGLMNESNVEIADVRTARDVELPADTADDPAANAESTEPETEAKPALSAIIPEATIPTDDRFRASSWGLMSASERLASATRELMPGEARAPLSTWRARQIRREADHAPNPVARNNILRRAGLA